jgi:hypothetical protein
MPIPLVLLKKKDWKVWTQNFTFFIIFEGFNLKKSDKVGYIIKALTKLYHNMPLLALHRVYLPR